VLVHLKSMPVQQERELSAFEFSLVIQPEQNHKPILPVHPGMVCPQCQEGRLEYNGLLELVCNECGFSSNGDCGCT